MFHSESLGGNLKAKGSNPTRTNVLFLNLCLIFLSAETLTVS